ncbi:hypothetical protein [Methylomonas sp. AM2-LC]|uniref:hypothetical protein n=1 Tax=Methylomonas sp. AM2-LC TaxID=3153301 RepID=UPI003266B53B
MQISAPYLNPNNQLQCDATGEFGKYIIRKTADNNWQAIQLFGAVGLVVNTENSPEAALQEAELYYQSSALENSDVSHDDLHAAASFFDQLLADTIEDQKSLQRAKTLSKSLFGVTATGRVLDLILQYYATTHNTIDESVKTVMASAGFMLLVD